MLHLRIAAIGRDRDGAFSALTQTYLDRARDAGRGIGLSGPDLHALDAPRSLQGVERQIREGQLLGAAALPGGDAIVLDERGKDMTSTGFADFLAARRDAGVPGLSFFIGGADGHHASFDGLLAPRSVRRIAFGKATWPHMLVRIMAAEQIYRAVTILAGHPYHRA